MTSDMVKFGIVSEQLKEHNIDVVLHKYKDDECSCCYGPDIIESRTTIVIPLNIAENQGGYVEEYIKDDYDDYEKNPSYLNGVNDYFNSYGNLKSKIFIGHDGEYVKTAYEHMKKLFGERLSWDGSKFSKFLLTK